MLLTLLVLLTGQFCFFHLLPSFPVASASNVETYWPSGYGYEQNYTVPQTSGDGTNYQINITVDNATGSSSGFLMHANGHILKSDYSDILIKNSTGSTLNVWNETVNTGSSGNITIWINVPDNITSASAGLYVYYGNSAATSPFNGDNTFNFYDNFPGTSLNSSRWDTYNSPTVTVSNSWVTVQSVSGNTWKGIRGKTSQQYGRFRCYGRLPQTPAAGVYEALGATGDTIPNLNTLVWVWESTYYLYTSDSSTYNMPTTNGNTGNNTYEIRWKSGNAQFLQNGSLCTNGNFTTHLPTVAIMSYAAAYGTNNNASMDWCFISKYATDPAAGTWGSEASAPTAGSTYTISETITSSASRSSSIEKLCRCTETAKVSALLLPNLEKTYSSPSILISSATSTRRGENAFSTSNTIILYGLNINATSVTVYHLPYSTFIPAGMKVHFGPYWISSSGVGVLITSWFVNGWTNYTVTASGTQQIYHGDQPSTVYINGVNQPLGTGWSYSGGVVTITSAASSASLQWAVSKTLGYGLETGYPLQSILQSASAACKSVENSYSNFNPLTILGKLQSGVESFFSRISLLQFLDSAKSNIEKSYFSPSTIILSSSLRTPQTERGYSLFSDLVLTTSLSPTRESSYLTSAILQLMSSVTRFSENLFTSTGQIASTPKTTLNLQTGYAPQTTVTISGLSSSGYEKSFPSSNILTSIGSFVSSFQTAGPQAYTYTITQLESLLGLNNIGIEKLYTQTPQIMLLLPSSAYSLEKGFSQFQILGLSTILASGVEKLYRFFEYPYTSDSMSSTLYVWNNYIIARFSFSPPNPQVGQTVTFDASQSNSSATITSYYWTWGDGTAPLNTTVPTATHSYGSSGIYLVTLTVTSSVGNNSFSQPIVVGQVGGQGPHYTSTLTVQAINIMVNPSSKILINLTFAFATSNGVFTNESIFTIETINFPWPINSWTEPMRLPFVYGQNGTIPVMLDIPDIPNGNFTGQIEIVASDPWSNILTVYTPISLSVYNTRTIIPAAYAVIAIILVVLLILACYLAEKKYRWGG
jgi:hypothetical protein